MSDKNALLKNKNKNKMETQISEAEMPQATHTPFGEKFAYLAISMTVAYTYAIINIMSYM